jgi:hypothetical protein
VALTFVDNLQTSKVTKRPFQTASTTILIFRIVFCRF